MPCPAKRRNESRIQADQPKPAILRGPGGAQKVYWILKRDGKDKVVATDRFSFSLDAGRVTGDQAFKLQFKAIYPDEVKTKDVSVTIREDIPEPMFTLHSPVTWDGREVIEVVAQVTNLEAMRAKGTAELNHSWNVLTLPRSRKLHRGSSS